MIPDNIVSFFAGNQEALWLRNSGSTISSQALDTVLIYSAKHTFVQRQAAKA